MPERWTIRFGRPGDPARGGASKFGGQPDWIAAPQWPVARSTGGPMRFLAQIELPPPLRVGGHRMAYLFLADHDPKLGSAPYDYDTGDNAVILQGGPRFRPATPTVPSVAGPTLRIGVKKTGMKFDDDPATAEATVPVRLEPATEPERLSEQDLHDLWVEDRPAHAAYTHALTPSKVGGSPLWLQGPDTPLGGPWALLAQLDIEHIPCWAPFDGWLFAFVAPDGSEGRMLYQIT